MPSKPILILICASITLSACSPQTNTMNSSTVTQEFTQPTTTPPLIPTSLPTPPPLVRIESGDQALFFGDFDMARNEYRQAFNDSTDPAIKAASLWGLGRTELADENYQAAIENLNTLTNEYPDSTYAARSYFLSGQAYSGLGLAQLAADAYATYMIHLPGVIDGYVQDYRGDVLYQAGDYTNAINAYEVALNASRLDDGMNLQIKIAQSRFDFGDYAGALNLFDQIFNTTSNDYTRAQVEYFAGNTQIKLGLVNEAQTRYMHIVENYPLSPYAYLALVDLIDAGIEVNDLDRGLVDFFAGQYSVALVALERYINDNPVNDGTAAYYRALTLRDLGQNQQAVNAFDAFIEGYPLHERWVDAWEQKATLQWIVMNDYQAAIDTLIKFVATAPASSSAADFLMTAARITERDGRLEDAANLWGRVAEEYPSNSYVSEALFLAGIAKYRLTDYTNALTLFQRDLILSLSAEERARAYFWIGKTQEILGESDSATQSWQQGQHTDPYGYYSLRAEDKLLQRSVFQSHPNGNLTVDLIKERRDAEAWIRITFELPPNTDLSGPAELSLDPRFIRGTELWELGLYDVARKEFESLRESVQLDPIASFRLANHLHDIGLYRTAIFAAREVLTLAGLESQSASLTAPAYFNHLRYGLYYHDLILEEEKKYDLDQLFMFSVIRQESLFEGFVRSSAGARGLMQIIPDTGLQIARELDWPSGYVPEDLYRPNVSIRFGSYYLDKNRRLLGNSIYGSLAAYNAGPGNALVWKELAGDDPDLFLEIVRFQETRNYIRFIYEIYHVYQMIYGF